MRHNQDLQRPVNARAPKHAIQVMTDSNPCVVMVDGADIDRVEPRPAAIVDVFNREVRHAMQIKVLKILLASEQRISCALQPPPGFASRLRPDSALCPIPKSGARAIPVAQAVPLSPYRAPDCGRFSPASMLHCAAGQGPS
jgi:hypothetical protein